MRTESELIIELGKIQESLDIKPNSEFQVLNQGHESFYKTNIDSFNKIKPVFDKMFGDKK